MDNSAEEKFLLEGIRRYSSAVDTIRAFETMMKERLRLVVKAYAFTNFTATKEPIATGVTESGGAHWIWATQRRLLKSRKTVAVEIGMAWKGAQVAYYCNLLDAEYNVINFSYGRNHKRVEARMWSRKARLFMLAPSTGSIDLDSEFKILLDELMFSVT